MFPDIIGSIYETLVEAHSRYTRSITLEELRALHKSLNTTLTRAQRNAVEELLIDLENDRQDIGPDVAQDVLQHMWRTAQGARIATLGLDLHEGRTTNLDALTALLAEIDGGFTPQDDFKPVTTDVGELLETLDARPGWTFNLAELKARIGGVSGGDFGIVFGRPELGKTGCWVSMAVAPEGFIDQGAKVDVFCNEEPAIRTMIRAVSCATGMLKDEIRASPGKATALFAKAKQNLRMYDAVGLSLDRIAAHCKKHRPDILVVDQLDKVRVDGVFARDDLRLREIYVGAREIAKTYECFVLGICQASADAEGKTKVHYSMMEGSKTGKAAEADLIIGVGAHPSADDEEEDLHRHLYVSKNKISGWHGTAVCVLNKAISRYEN